jgi:hypothetical protein
MVSSVSGFSCNHGRSSPARCSAVVALGWALVIGCSAKPTGMPDVAPVMGTVTLNGEPLAGASVVFQSESGHSAMGTTDSTGSYQLTAPGNQKGAVVGLNKVRINSHLSAQVNPGKNSFNFALERK